ncbi:MAG: hypothetical protein K1X42_03410 [Opitutaceae bacterium]|nr:hypothetical protein [Opitutaceae bacterium]
MRQAEFVLCHHLVDGTKYHPTFLANGYWGMFSSIRGSDTTLGYLSGLIDRSAGDVSRPAALPAWNSIDLFNGYTWLNTCELSSQVLQNYRQTLDMKAGILETEYDWHDADRVMGVKLASFFSQNEPHLAASLFSVTPAQSGQVRFQFTLGRVTKEPSRLALAKVSWTELKDILLRSNATIDTGTHPSKRPVAPSEILTWIDLQIALAAEGRMLSLEKATSPSRAALWYPGVADVKEVNVDPTRMILTLRGRAQQGVAFEQALALDLPKGLDIINVHSGIEDSRAVLEITAHLHAGKTYSFARYASVSREGWSSTAANDAARVESSRHHGWDRQVAAQVEAWSTLWLADIEVDGDADFQRVVRSELFQLLQASTSEYFSGVGACGLTPNYFGHVFWDADYWLFPVLLLLHPERARHLVDFRFRTLGWAKANAEKRGFRGAMYPWESDAELGTEQTPRFAGVNGEREILLNGTIAIAQWQYFIAIQDHDWLRNRGYPVISATADFWVSRVTPSADGTHYEVIGVTSVDEKYTDVNNEAFTNAVARRNLEIATLAATLLGLEPDPLWLQVATRLSPPFSEAEQRHRVFDENVPHNRRTWMAGSLTFLSSPNLDWPMSPEVRLNNYRYALRKNAELSPEPNQMMQSMLASHAAQLGDGEAALYWLTHDQEAFLKPPFLLRSETASNNCTHHLAAGCGFLQGIIYGFTGLRIKDAGLQETYAPVLPKAWRSLTLRGIQFRGERFDIVVVRDKSGKVVLNRQAPLSPPISKDAHQILARKAAETLDANWRGGYTIPSARLYPFQWSWDSGFIALGLACHRPERAMEEIRNMFRGQWRNGLLPHIVFHRDDPNYFPGPDVWGTASVPDGPQNIRTSGIVQPPVFAFVLDRIASMPIGRSSKWKEFEGILYPQLLAFHRYLYQQRDPNREGLVYIQHNWEAGTDNSPTWDPVLETIDIEQTRDVSRLRRDIRNVSADHRPSNENYRRYIYLVDLFKRCDYRDEAIAAESPFLVQDVLFNAILVRSNLALIAMGQRNAQDTAEVERWNEKTIAAMNLKLWDEREGFYFPYDLRGERRLTIKTSSGFMPLLAGIPSQTQAARLVQHLHGSFVQGQDWRLCASTAPTEPSFDPVRYWRGPIWANLNWMLHHGLRRYGFEQEAEKLKQDTLDLLSEGGLFEYFNPKPGNPKGLGSDNFSWSAALALDLIRNPTPL